MKQLASFPGPAQHSVACSTTESWAGARLSLAPDKGIFTHTLSLCVCAEYGRDSSENGLDSCRELGNCEIRVISRHKPFCNHPQRVYSVSCFFILYSTHSNVMISFIIVYSNVHLSTHYILLYSIWPLSSIYQLTLNHLTVSVWKSMHRLSHFHASSHRSASSHSVHPCLKIVSKPMII